MRAKYSDGTDRDVTYARAVPDATTTPPRRSTPTASVTAGERGEAFVMARFATFTVGVAVHHPAEGPAVRPGRTSPENNYIDTLVHAKLKKLRIAPSGLCNDETFLRRVYLDVIGLLPTPEEYARFMAEHAPNKREQLVDELLGRKEFAELWVMKWAELLQIRSVEPGQLQGDAAVLQLAAGQDRQQRADRTSGCRSCSARPAGRSRTRPTNYYQNETRHPEGDRERRPGVHGHAHPVRPVPQPPVRPLDDGRLLRLRGVLQPDRPQGRRTTRASSIVFNTGGGEVNHPVRGQPMKPKFLGGAEPDVAGQGPPRRCWPNWLASPENPYFATNLANIVWAHFFGQGIIDEVDDVRIRNPASNPELLAELGKKFTDYKYDFKKLVRDICTSRTYQLSTQPTPIERGRHAQLRPRPDPPHPGRDDARLHQRR